MKFRTLGLLAVIGIMCASLPGCGDSPPSGMTKISVSSDQAVTIREDFAKPSKDWQFAEGSWNRRKSGDGQVLAQTATDKTYPVALWKAEQFGDVDASVKFKPISGDVDAGGGILFRAKDAQNYYVVRANSLENNFRLYTVVKGLRSQIASANINAPVQGKWHTMRVVAVGSHIQAYLNGQLLINHHDKTFSAGWVGLWTKEDAVTEFDDVIVKGMTSQSK